MKKNRPLEIGILSLLLAWLSVWNGLRLVESFRFWDTSLAYDSQPGPLYIALSGGVWCLLAALLAWATWTGKRWSRGTLLGTGVVYAIWVWIDRFLLQNPHGNEVFTRVAIIAGFIMFILLLSSKNTRDFSHE
jgi:hypothetical protein